MPEIKNQFTAGKMNKDLDERLIPKGEYRHAMNVQVSTSEGSDVGTVQNILGNVSISLQGGVTLNDAKVLGSVSDEKNDILYYLVRDQSSQTSYIFSVASGTNATLVFVDKFNVLGLTLTTRITGINVIDDMLFWTDGVTEPKKINIPRSIEGTFNNGNFHTRLINRDQGIVFSTGIDITEEHVTVARKAPTQAPQLNMVGERAGNSYADFRFNFTALSSGDEVVLTITAGVNYIEGDTLLIKFNDGHPDISPIIIEDVRVVIDSISGNSYTCTILSIASSIPSGINDYSCDLDKSYEKLYKLKFPRFAIRYKYQDGEYSAFGPFSEVAFMPGSWNQDPEKVSYLPNTGYNLGMENKLRELTLTNIIPFNLPKDVKQVDILYKESNSPNVYVVDEIKDSDIYWTSDSYLIQQENIKSVLPSNQLLRLWDNVPRKALAQEISGSRVIYGNYTQNYNIDTVSGNTINSFRPNFTVNLKERADSTMKSVKSIREYQLGVVYADKYNRQTPVFTDTTGALSVPKKEASKSNQIEIKPKHSPPSWATHHKFYIKETSTEYYNLSLDRYFDAEDGNIWLSFPSNDRDKMDLETVLYLKKRFNSNDPELSVEKYKVIDIKNEAPEYLQTRRAAIGRAYNNHSTLSVSSTQVWSGGGTTLRNGGMPVPGQKEIKVQVDSLINTLLADFHKRQNSPDPNGEGGGPMANNVLFMRIGFTSDGEVDQPYRTEWYEIDNVVKTDNHYVIKLKTDIKDEAGWIQQPGSLGSQASHLISTLPTTGVQGSLYFEIGQDIVQNKAVFQGRFFAKILRDEYIDRAIVNAQNAFDDAQVVATADCGWLKDFDKLDPFSLGNFANGWNHSESDYEDAIDSFNSIGPNYTNGSYTSNTPDGVSVPNKSYWGHSVWQRISRLLDVKGSRWIIDQAFAAGEEPLWKYRGGVASDETNFFAGTPGSFPGALSLIGGSVIYGGYHSESANPTTLNHNETSTGSIVDNGNTVESVPNRKGLGHGTTTANYEYFTVGSGVQSYTIDISYLSPGRRDLGNASDVYGDSQVNASYLNTNSAQFTDDRSDWPNFYTISNGASGFNNGIGNSNEAQEAQKFADNLVPGAVLRFQNDPLQIKYKITGVKKFYKSNYAETLRDAEYPLLNTNTTVVPNMFGWTGTANTTLGALIQDQQPLGGGSGGFGGFGFGGGIGGLITLGSPLTQSGSIWASYLNTAHFNRRVTFRLTLECIASPGAHIGTDAAGNNNNYDVSQKYDSNGNPTNPIDLSKDNNCPIEILSVDYFGDDDVDFPENPAIFETEPKDSVDLDIFHEASDTLPLDFNGPELVPIGSIATATPAGISTGQAAVVSWFADDIIELSQVVIDDNLNANQFFTFTRPDGSYVTLKFMSLAPPINTLGPSDTSFFIKIDTDIANNRVGLGWNNCYSFGNGIESNRIRDTFNSTVIDKGPKVSTTLDTVYEEENRKYGLIYSGIYNSISGVNNLNQFIQAEKITKDLSPTYGSVQKLYAGWGQGGDLLAFCEDRVLKILANKDALFNADGNTNITSTNNVLGTATPYSGDYGISKNPESFASKSFRAYFTDKVRGTVMRLSMDGLTPISSFGMKDYFKDNLKNFESLIGSYDDKKDEYNITLSNDNVSINTQTDAQGTTVTFKENVKGWVSFKSFTPENAISCANEYYTFRKGNIWKHHVETNPESRNTFYGGTPYEQTANSDLHVVLNDSPSSIKTFNTLNYEGSQSNVTINTIDGEYYNLQNKFGWGVNKLSTDKQTGFVDEFIEKEGKWFNYIKGEERSINVADKNLGSFEIQGLGTVGSISGNVVTMTHKLNISLQVGDAIYYAGPVPNGGFDVTSSNLLQPSGKVINIIDDVTFELDNLVGLTATRYCLFVKNQMINTSSLLGYYMEAQFTNTSTTKAELYSIGSEVSESSK